MKILSFSYCFPNESNGNWGVFVEQRLAAMGARVELQVVSPVPTFPLRERMRGSAGPTVEQWRGLTVHRPRFFCFPGVLKSLDARLYASGLRSWLAGFVQDWRPDLLDAHFVWPDGVGVSLLAKELGIPYAITLRGKIYPCLKIAAQRRQCAEALRNAAAVISVDERMAQIACDLGAAPDRVSVIPNGVDIDHFQPGDRVAARRQLGLPLDGRLLVTVAHLGQRKGHYETIEALAPLPADVRLVLVGGDTRRGRDAFALRKFAAKHGVADRLILAGRQPYEKIPLYFNAADISVLASWREGCPNVVLESLASGTPAVASDVGAVSMLIQNGSNGRIVPPQDAQALSRAIGELLDEPIAPERVRRCPAVRSWDETAEQVMDCFDTIVRPRATPPEHCLAS